jgi:hypothetical protein
LRLLLSGAIYGALELLSGDELGRNPELLGQLIPCILHFNIEGARYLFDGMPVR